MTDKYINIINIQQTTTIIHYNNRKWGSFVAQELPYIILLYMNQESIPIIPLLIEPVPQPWVYK
ncbi:ORF42 [White spot syndrome virus]|uniref:ORF42 n=1 Tax=White spot syndrome virus TaxID=342409 RepID=A0A2D3I6U6_9VIRU|nr:ORF42 [White spot syndrome virus]